jgi:DNA-binding transcriptional MocR family regulator
MRSPSKTTAVVLTGAVALSSAAYGIGTQIGGGSAAADGKRSNGNAARGWERGPAPGLGDLADELSVKPGELRDAVRDFHERRGSEHRDRFASALADALGISVERVEAGLDEVRASHEKRFASRLAQELGVSADRVEAALEALADDRPRDPRAFVEALADELGVEAEAVQRALWSARPERRGGHPPRLPLRALADALDVSRDDLRKAFRQLQTEARDGFRKGHDELVQFLADRFDLSTEKVQEALPERPEFKGPRPPGPPGGPGLHGPPPFGP